MKKILVTGSAGFIGYSLVKRLMQMPDVDVVGIDNVNDYYDVDLKYARLSDCGIDSSTTKDSTDYIQSSVFKSYRFKKIDISDSASLKVLFDIEKFDLVVNMAAQAGVRYSLINPEAYVRSNLIGFSNLLECCRHYNVKHFVYASSSSVYGMSKDIPFTEDQNVDYPVSFYAATKKSNELMAHSYSHLYKLPTTGLRFFTVYGPWGRPDMAPMIFVKAIYGGQPIKVFNNGNMLRDFTYIDDIIEGVVRVLDVAPNEKQEHPYYQILNIGHSCPVKLMDFISTLESEIGQKAIVDFQPMQPGDVTVTYADTSRLEECIHYKPMVTLEHGIRAFVQWYKTYFGL